MKKIVQILYSGLAGTGAVFFSMVDSDLGRAFEHHAIFYGVEPLREEYQKNCEKLGVKHYYFHKKPGLDFSTQNKIRKQIGAINPDGIINHSMLTVFACFGHRFRNPHCKLIAVEHHSNQLKRRKLWTLSKLNLKLSDHTVYLTPNYKKEIEEKFGLKLNERSTSIIPNGIDLNVFKPDESQNKTEEISLGILSRLTVDKDHPSLLKAMKLLKDKAYFNRLKLYIAGGGATQEPLEKMTKEFGLEKHVIFTGFLEEQQIVTFLQSLDFYVHPTFGETMSTAIMQAQATGLPIISNDVQGINNVITHNENGLLVKLKDEKELAATIDQLITDEGLRTILSQASLKYAKANLSSEVMAEKYFSLFQA